MAEIIVKMDKHIKIKGGEYVADLVRCKECKHWTYEELCDVFTKPTCFDDFCSYGEVRDEQMD